MTFEDWIKQVKAEYQRIAGFIPTPFDEESYRDYFNDDYTPTATVYEDLLIEAHDMQVWRDSQHG